VEAVPVLFWDNSEFDQPKFKKAMADPTHWVARNLDTRLGAVCGMLTVISAGRPATGLTITVWGPEVRGAIGPVLAARFAPLTGVPDALVLTGTAIGAVVSPNHSSAGTATQCPATKQRHAARPAHAPWHRPPGQTRAHPGHAHARAGLNGGGKEVRRGIDLALGTTRALMELTRQVTHFPFGRA
jgi:hypothetical protein